MHNFIDLDLLLYVKKKKTLIANKNDSYLN